MLVKENLFDFKGFKLGYGNTLLENPLSEFSNGKLMVENYNRYYREFIKGENPKVDPIKKYTVGFLGLLEGEKIDLYLGTEYYRLQAYNNFLYRELTTTEKELSQLDNWYIKVTGKVLLFEPFIIEGTLADINLPKSTKLTEENKQFYKIGNFKEIKSI